MKVALWVVWVGIIALFTAVAAIFSLPSFIIAPTAITLLGLFLLSTALISLTGKKSKSKNPLLLPATQEDSEEFDSTRRNFLKAIGALGLGALISYFIWPRKASALSFGGSGGAVDPVGIKPLGGQQTTGSITLTNADTWYPVPAEPLSERVFLVLQNRSGVDMYWSFDNSVSASTGGLLFPNGATLTLDANADVEVYVRCGTAGQTCWYSESQSQ